MHAVRNPQAVAKHLHAPHGVGDFHTVGAVGQAIPCNGCISSSTIDAGRVEVTVQQFKVVRGNSAFHAQRQETCGVVRGQNADHLGTQAVHSQCTRVVVACRFQTAPQFEILGWGEVTPEKAIDVSCSVVLQAVLISSGVEDIHVVPTKTDELRVQVGHDQFKAFLDQNGFHIFVQRPHHPILGGDQGDGQALRHRVSSITPQFIVNQSDHKFQPRTVRG